MQQQMMQQSWLQQMQQAAMANQGQFFSGFGSMPFQMGAGSPAPGAPGSGSQGRILELEQKGPCDFCGGAHNQDQCTKYRDCIRKGKAEVRSEIAAKIAARKAAADAKKNEGSES